MIYKNDVKISYSGTNTISKIIDNHNKKLINILNWNNINNMKHSCNYKICYSKIHQISSDSST